MIGAKFKRKNVRKFKVVGNTFNHIFDIGDVVILDSIKEVLDVEVYLVRKGDSNIQYLSPFDLVEIFED